MALCSTNDLATETGEAFLRPGDHCFHCGEPLAGDVWAYWQGADEAGTQVWLHPTCAKRLADALNRDWLQFTAQHPEKLCPTH